MNTIAMMIPEYMQSLISINLLAVQLNRPEFRFLDLLFPWIAAIGLSGFLVAWLVVALMERTGLSRYVWHLPLFFVALVILFGSLIGMEVFP
jgi:Protein of unknown function (DUF1656)